VNIIFKEENNVTVIVIAVPTQYKEYMVLNCTNNVVTVSNPTHGHEL
jgi:hypothetical protein